MSFVIPAQVGIQTTPLVFFWIPDHVRDDGLSEQETGSAYLSAKTYPCQREGGNPDSESTAAGS